MGKPDGRGGPDPASGGASVHALATPLITRSDGSKYGKTETDALFLDPALTSPYAFYQFFLNTADADAGQLLRVFSLRSRSEIEEMERSIAERPEERRAQQALAEELTTMLHGADQARAVMAASQAIFGRGDLRALDEATVAAVAAAVPGAEVDGELPSLTDLLVASGLVSSRSEARRTVTEGGAYLNNERVADPERRPTSGDLLHGRWLVLRKGKRSVAMIERKG